jgi:hypothetical protein
VRVLITGCTPQHTGKPHPLNYALTSHLVAEGLRASGHQVDQRAVVPGEKLRREYDHAFVYWFNPEAGNARHILGALWTLLEFPHALIGIEDWTIGRTFSNTRRVVRNPTLLTNPSFLRPKYQEEARPYYDRFIAKLEQLVEGQGHHNIALSLFPWGDRARLGIPNHDLLRWFDPSPLVTPLYRKLERRADRERKWVLGALTKQIEWLAKQRLSWPVGEYGNRKLRQPRLNEIDLVRRYGEVEGVLSFRTSIAGSGWWRVRFVHAAAMRCVLAGDPRETSIIGDPYRYTPHEVEGLSPADRRDLAHEQAKLFFRRSFTKKQLIDRLDQLVRENSDRKK